MAILFLFLTVFIPFCFAGLNNCLNSVNTISCSRNVILAFDGTSYMMNQANIRQEFDFMEDYVLPQLHIGYNLVNVGITVFGTGKTTSYDFTDDRQLICQNLEDAYSSIKFSPSANVGLARTLRNIYNNFEFNSTSLVMFIASTDQADVDSGGVQLQSYVNDPSILGFSVVVIRYHSNATYNMWPSKVTKVYNFDVNNQPDLSTKVDNSICDPIYTAPPPKTTPTIRPPITTATPGKIATGDYSGCTCILNQIWVDVFVLIDSSRGMEEHGVDEATDFILAVFAKLSIGQVDGYNTRLGIISYSDSVVLVRSLTSMNSTNDIFNIQVPYLNQTGSNIEGAIKLASQQFATSDHRQNARKIIIILASTYSSGGYNDPTQMADTFKVDDGIIITIEYEQVHGVDVSQLRKLASPNYNLTNYNLHASAVQFLLCEANCFCPVSYAAYNNDIYGAPQGGCYNPVTLSTLQRLASKYCTQHHDSTLSIIEDQAKNMFLMELFPPRSKYWIGLTYTNNNWMWPLNYSLGYSNWAKNEPDYSKGNCAYSYQYSGFNFAWFVDDCSNDNYYVCQARPCDSAHYCIYEQI